MAKIKTLTILQGPTNTSQVYPQTFTDISSLEMKNEGTNRILYELQSTGLEGTIDVGKSVVFPSYSGLFTETINFTFYPLGN